jgi:hypothetical protein
MQGVDRLALQTDAEYSQPPVTAKKRVLPVKIRKRPSNGCSWRKAALRRQRSANSGKVRAIRFVILLVG